MKDVSRDYAALGLKPAAPSRMWTEGQVFNHELSRSRIAIEPTYRDRFPISFFL